MVSSRSAVVFALLLLFAMILSGALKRTGPFRFGSVAHELLCAPAALDAISSSSPVSKTALQYLCRHNDFHWYLLAQTETATATADESNREHTPAHLLGASARAVPLATSGQSRSVKLVAVCYVRVVT